MHLSFSLSSPFLPSSFSPPISCIFALKGTVFLSVASPEQIYVLKCLLQLVSLTLLIILRSHDNSPLVSHLEFISFFSSSSLSTSEEKKIFSEERAIFLFKKKSKKMLLMQQPTNTKFSSWLIGLISERTLMRVANKANTFQYHIVWDRNDHYTLCVWRYPGCCEWLCTFWKKGAFLQFHGDFQKWSELNVACRMDQ